jgi:hypothetical protein
MNNNVVSTKDAPTAREKRLQDWTAAEPFAALQEFHGQSGKALRAWPRAHGIPPHHLPGRETASCAELKRTRNRHSRTASFAGQAEQEGCGLM